MEDKKINVIIRQEEASDFPAVYDLNSQAFKRKQEARLVDRLRLSDDFIPELSLVATLEGKVVGYILFSKISIIDNDKENISLSLAPIAVCAEMQHKGIGSRLIYAGLDKAKELGYQSVIVLGHPDYYPRYGFEPTTKWQIRPPFNIPEKSFMAIELVEGGLSDVRGIVRYSKEFEDI